MLRPHQRRGTGSGRRPRQSSLLCTQLQQSHHCRRSQNILKILKIFSDRCLEAISNTRLRNLKEKTLRYRFHMVHIPAVKKRAADALSRHPSGSHNPNVCPSLTMLPPPTSAPPPISSHIILAGTHTSELDTTSPTLVIEKQLLSAAIKSSHSLALTWYHRQFPRISPPTPTQPTRILPISGAPIYRRWRSIIQRSHCDPSITNKPHPIHPPLSPPRSHLHECPCRSNRLLAWHHTRNPGNERILPTLQPKAKGLVNRLVSRMSSQRMVAPNSQPP